MRARSLSRTEPSSPVPRRSWRPGRFGQDDGPCRLPGPGGTAEHAVRGRGHRVLDRRHEPAFLAVAVSVPRRAPDAVQVPAQVAEYLLAEPVAVAGGLGGVVL